MNSSWKMSKVVLYSCLFCLAASLPTISIIGSKFYDTNGNQFFIKGVVYQPGGTGISYDPLSAEAQCTQDAKLMQELGVNLIRVQSVKAASDHSGCMSAFEAAGIYVLLDFNSFTASFDASYPMWTADQYNDCIAVMDAFANNTNTFGFVAGNELVHNLGQTNAASYIKAAILDLKNYRKSRGYRDFPIGHTSQDIDGLMPFFQDYLACGSQSIDFFGLNCFRWCGASNFVDSGYSNLEANSTDYNIPLFFSETGCTLGSGKPRNFADQAAIFGPDMNSQWSGAIIYEWTNETSGFGLVTYGSFAVTTGTPTVLPGDYTNLQSEWATLTPTGTINSLYTTIITAPACPSFTSNTWLLSGDVPLPTLFEGLAASGSTSTTPTASPTASTGLDNLDTETGLSNVAEVEIAIGVILFLVFLTVLGFFFWRRSKKSLRAPVVNPSPEAFEVGVTPIREMNNNSANAHDIEPPSSTKGYRKNKPAKPGGMPTRQQAQRWRPPELPAGFL